MAPSAVAEETQPVEASQPVTALAAVPEATRPVQQKVVEKAALQVEKATEETVVAQPKTAETASPVPEPVMEFPRGGGGPGGVGGAGGAGGPGSGGEGATGPGGSSDLGPGVEPIPTAAPPQPEKAASEKSVKETAKATEPTVRSARAVETTLTVTEDGMDKAQVTPAPTPAVAPPAIPTPLPTPAVPPSPTAAPTETPVAVALDRGESTPEPIAILPAQVPEQAQRAAPQPFAWETPLRIAEFSLGILIVLLLAASWIAARRT